MRRKQIQPYGLALGLALLLTSCFNEPNYADTPAIEFRGLFRYTIEAGKGVGQSKRDSVVVTVGFKDGDGNMGNDTPVSKADSALYASNGGWGNYEIRTFRLVNRQYQEVILPINKTLYFPDLTKNKPKGPIEGTLDFSSTFPYGNSFQLFPVKFQIRIRDRALNVSNVIETDTVTVPFPRN
ncbi:hypothetical protein [Spirosoma luteolum]